MLLAVVFSGSGALWERVLAIHDGHEVRIEVNPPFAKILGRGESGVLIDVDGEQGVAKLSRRDWDLVKEARGRLEGSGGGWVCASVVYDRRLAQCVRWLATAVKLYPEVKDAVRELRRLGADVFILSDVCEKLTLGLAKELGVHELFVRACYNHIAKQAFVDRLNNFYGAVIMVGYDDSDVGAFEKADVAILLKRGRDLNEELVEEADYVVEDLSGVVKIAKEILGLKS